jgi:hypothetical protein
MAAPTCKTGRHVLRGPQDRDPDGRCKHCRRMAQHVHYIRKRDALRKLKEMGIV